MDINNTIVIPKEIQVYDSFNIYGKNKYVPTKKVLAKKVTNKLVKATTTPENIIFGKVEIFFENKSNKIIKLHTIFIPSEYAKMWLKNNIERLGKRAKGQKEIHKYKKYSLFNKIKDINSNFDKIIKANITKNEIVENVNFHMKEIIQKLNTRTRHEYKFTPNNIF